MTLMNRAWMRGRATARTRVRLSSIPQRAAANHRQRIRRSPPSVGQKNAIFVGHGSNRRPMDQLVKILNEYGIPHQQAVDEPNRARPIPLKVAEVMRECGAAILVFTADKEYFDKDGRSIWRPSENVSHELGAASVLHGDRIIVVKEGHRVALKLQQRRVHRVRDG
jgi:hypothetical protein